MSVYRLGYDRPVWAIVKGQDMNLSRRAQIQKAIDIIEQTMEEEQEAYDNMPEAFQGGEQGEKAQMACDGMGQAVDELMNVLER